MDVLKDSTIIQIPLLHFIAKYFIFSVMLYRNCKKRKVQNANSSKIIGSSITISNNIITCIITIMITLIIIVVVIITSVLLTSLTLLLLYICSNITIHVCQVLMILCSYD